MTITTHFAHFVRSLGPLYPFPVLVRKDGVIVGIDGGTLERGKVIPQQTAASIAIFVVNKGHMTRACILSVLQQFLINAKESTRS